MLVNGIRVGDVAKGEISSLLIRAIMDEGVLQKDIAIKLQVNPPDISWMKDKHNWKNVKESTWFKFAQWRASGLTLTEYMNKFGEVTELKEVEKKEGIIYTEEFIANLAEHIEGEVNKSKKQDLLEQGQLKLQDDDEIKTIQFHQKMKECWDELEQRGTVEKFLRSMGYTGTLKKVVTTVIEFKV
jgi:hypothetical protein